MHTYYCLLNDLAIIVNLFICVGRIGEWFVIWVVYIFLRLQSSVVALNSSSNNDWMIQSLVNNVIGSTSNETKLIQPVRCEVCNIECNTKDVYEKHLMGKKHQRNLQVKINPTTTIFPNTSNTINNVSIVGQTGNVGGQMIFGASGVANDQELEREAKDFECWGSC